MKVAVLQQDIVWEDRDENLARLAPRIAGAAGAGARLVVLPEMFSSGFSMNTARTAEPIDGPSSAFLVRSAADHGIWICGSVAERSPGVDRPHNTLILAGPQGEVHRYRKIHPFTYAGEHEHFAAGGRFTTVTVEGMRITLFVCYDLRFADEFWATAPDTDAYVVVANWPATRRLHWRTLLRARAIENQAYVIGCNRVGSGGGLDYAGDSAIIDPMGELLASAAGVEATLLSEVEPRVVADVRARLPFLQDRRGTGAGLAG